MVALELRRAFPLSWRMVRSCRLPTAQQDEPYYLSFEPGGGIFGEQWTAFDENCVLYKGTYNPVSISQYALHLYDRARLGDKDAQRGFLAQIEYLCRAQDEDGLYRYSVPNAPYGLSPGWISAMAQGEVFSVLLRAYALTKNATYLDRATAALRPFERDVSQGGVSFIRNHDVFFEEIAGCPAHVLNGHLFAAFGVWEACRYGLASPILKDLHAASIETLLRWLPDYDDDGWSFYQLAVRDGGERHYAPIQYHQTHIAQLKVYAAMTERAQFAEMSQRWRAGLDRWDVRVRVWADSASWLSQLIKRRISGKSAAPWQPLPAQR
jgi:hypothetical protein